MQHLMKNNKKNIVKNLIQVSNKDTKLGNLEWLYRFTVILLLSSTHATTKWPSGYLKNEVTHGSGSCALPTHGFGGVMTACVVSSSIPSNQRSDGLYFISAIQITLYIKLKIQTVWFGSDDQYLSDCISAYNNDGK